jgi:hypothetical protein
LTGRIIRPSQFILSYGVGSIIETDRGSRIIPSFQKWGKYFSKYSSKEIDDSSAINQLLNNKEDAKIFSIPTNSDLKKSDNKNIYQLFVFPRWGVCMMHSGVPILGKINETGSFDCPSCKRENLVSPKITGIRFVCACPKGHLDDVDWPYFVHLNNETECDGVLFGWTGEGQTANDIKIQCLRCRSQTRLSQIYKLSREDQIICSGIFAEKIEKQKKCSSNARLLLRSGSNLRIPDIQVSVSIPYRDSELYKILSAESYYTIISLIQPKNVKDLVMNLRKSMATNPKIKEAKVRIIETFSDKELSYVIDQLVRDKNNGKVTEQNVKMDEYIALLNASKNGHPPEHTGKQSRFEVEKSKVKEIDMNSTKWNLPFVVTPIKTLTVILVQTGYRRMVGSVKGDLVPTYYEDDEGNAWFPGIETNGEGIFISLKNYDLDVNNESWKIWMKIYENKRNQINNKDDCYKFHPLFVWWHSLSHRIINSLAIESGYSSASIRERIYTRADENNSSSISGGMLLYTTQTGGDGTLGGLIAQTSSFENILNKSINNLDSCSNDPLCANNKIHILKENGAACYTCMLLSETSCEHRNRFLDRNIFSK